MRSAGETEQNRTESVDVTPTAELLAAMQAPPAKQQPLPLVTVDVGQHRTPDGCLRGHLSTSNS